MPVSTDGGRLRRFGAAALVASIVVGCGRAERSAPDAGASAAPRTSSSAGLPAADGTAPAGLPAADEITPVYPALEGAPEPHAARLCEALHALPARRKAACRGVAAGFHATAACTRALSFAVRAGAVTLSPDDVSRCVAAMARSLEGCGWVSPLAAAVPPACEGIVRGTLGVGARCRSSLECVDGLRCDGAGPTDAGACRAPRAVGPCGRSVDALAAVTRQTRFAEAHPECRGHCAGRACADGAPPGAARGSTVQGVK
ncbi:hypothetical protein WMF31_04970 [Sorangium sp. So ce1036]|uniref:hypothetical protein n=1 Tax=Sorangium sp. So ce1036 TaxID=3133328 RepID=UPI003F0FF2B2